MSGVLGRATPGMTVQVINMRVMDDCDAEANSPPSMHGMVPWPSSAAERGPLLVISLVLRVGQYNCCTTAVQHGRGRRAEVTACIAVLREPFCSYCCCM